MEHKFGVFRTVEELNRAAAAQKAEGDAEALFALAEENGLDKEDAEDYLDGAAEELATPVMAAFGKLDLEARELNLESQLADWKDFVSAMCTESEEMSRAVFLPDKHLLDVLVDALKHASKNRIRLPRKLTRGAGIPDDSSIGVTSRADLRRIAEEYYLGKEGGVR